MRAVDTDVLVRLIVRDDSRQAAAAETFIAPGAWISTLALAETSWVLASVYEFTAKNIAIAIEMLLDHQHLVVQDSDTVAAALELYRSKPILGFSACLMLHLARRAGHLPLGTFDRHRSKSEGAEKL